MLQLIERELRWVYFKFCDKMYPEAKRELTEGLEFSNLGLGRLVVDPHRQV